MPETVEQGREEPLIGGYGSRMNLNELEPGQTLCDREFEMTAERVEAYLEAAGGDADIYRRLGIAPPMAVAALAMAAAMEAMALPAGAVHTGQELTFGTPAPIGARIRCVATVGAGSVRRGARFLSLDLLAADAAGGAPIVEGRTSLAIAGEAPA